MRIGVDLGGTHIAVCLCDDEGQMLLKKSVPTRTGDAEKLVADIRQLALAVCNESDVPHEQIESIGLGLPGTFEKETATLLFGTNLGVRNICFAKAFEPEFSCPVHIDNDANCAALGEFVRGAGHQADNMIMVTLGTGVGGGIILNGALYTAKNGIAGEIGHMVIEQNGARCNCGRRGCLEAYASAVGMCRLANEALRETTAQSALRGIENLNAKLICDAAKEQDVVAELVFKRYCRYLACGLTNLINLFQPDMIVLGGGVAGCGEFLRKPLAEYTEKQQFRGTHDNTKIALATLGNDAGLIGASLL